MWSRCIPSREYLARFHRLAIRTVCNHYIIDKDIEVRRELRRQQVSPRRGFAV